MTPRVGQRPPEAWSFMPPYREKPLPEKFRNGTSAPAENAVHFHHAPPPPAPVPPSGHPGYVVLAHGNWNTLREWSLVLASQQIPHHFDQSAAGPWYLEVPSQQAALASQQILLYREENPERPVHAPLPPLRLSSQPLWVLLIPILGTLWQFGHIGHERAGIADAEKIVNGEWWRIFTALTLHADSAHLASNLLSGFLVLALLAVRLPLSHITPALVVAAGLANLGVAFAIGSDFRSLGFSTFVFAALGALGTIEWRLRPPEGGNVIRRFAPWFGVFVLAVFMGLGENSDIFAHFFGLALGFAAGFVPSRKQLQWGSPPRLGDIVAILGVFAFFGLVWLRALDKLPLLG